MSSTHSAEIPNQRETLPFPHLHVPSEVYLSADDEELFQYVLERLKKSKLYKPGLVFAGFDAGEVLANKTFGARNSTHAYSEPMLHRIYSDEILHGEISPFVHADKRDGVEKPALGVFDSELMLGADGARFETAGESALGRVALSDLTEQPGIYDFWQTADGSSLDSATVALFTFEK